MPGALRAGWLLSGSVVLVAVVGCAEGLEQRGPGPSSLSPAVSQPSVTCSPGPVIDLGSPFPDAAPALFRTTGGALVFRAERFPHGGAFDPKTGQTVISLGDVGDPANYDAAKQDVVNATTRAVAVEKSQVVVELPAGEYWMVNSSGVWITVQGCTGVTVTLLRVG